jgi:hypothetical protein
MTFSKSARSVFTLMVVSPVLLLGAAAISEAQVEKPRPGMPPVTGQPAAGQQPTTTAPSPAATATGGNLGAGAAAGNMVAQVPIPLAEYAQGQAMMAQAAQNAALLDINFTFLDKTYKNDVWTGPSWARVRVSCVRFKATSGFQFKVDVPTFTLTPAGLTVTQNISKIKGDGLSARFQLGPCADIPLSSVGVQLTDVKVVYQARPAVTFSTEGACTIHWNQDTDDITVSIVDLNILGVQNDIDKLAKDAAREAINATLDGFYGRVMKNELLKVSVGTCGGGKK